jgi:hypothetical protein
MSPFKTATLPSWQFCLMAMLPTLCWHHCCLPFDLVALVFVALVASLFAAHMGSGYYLICFFGSTACVK